jgi:DNA-binding transcriptional ArsR family regulator
MPHLALAAAVTAGPLCPFCDVQLICLLSPRDGKVNMMVEDQVLDRTYAALADPTRRSLLVTLRSGEARITDLARPLPMSFAGVSRHVGVLEAAGLIHREIRGRDHWLSVQSEALRQAELWISEQTAFWTERADLLAARLEGKVKR